MSELKAYYVPTRSGNSCHCYLKSEADKVIEELKAERDEYRYNLSCARNEIHNMQAPMREDIKTITELKADYKEACDRLQTANLIKDEQIAATRHQKYKRCLAMAKWCLTEKVYFHYRYDDWGDRGYDRPYKWKKVVFWGKWARRWLKIAEQFKDKEAK